MRRNATKVAAAVLSLAVTMTSVNIPTSAAAATKKVKLNKTKATLTVGKSITLKLKQGSKTLKATFISSNKKIATVAKKTGKVTAKKKGTATITATYKKKKYKCKITVKAKPKPTVKPTVKPTAAPTTEPTAAPTTEPTAEPTTEPTATPADTVGAITSLEATSASTLKATFESAVPADAKIVVKKGTTEIAGTISKDDTNKIVTFTGSGNFTAGTYTMTATLGEASVSKDVEVKDSHVASIEITSKEALTNEEGDEAYIYYDVKNQYGESIRESENINWTTSPACDKVDRNTGRITIKQSKDKDGKSDKFIYGSSIYVTGVHVKTGTAVNTSIKVGMAQAADTVEFAGFLNKNDTTKPPIEKLPADFQKDTYVLLYRTLDQNGNALDVDLYTGDKHITFISDNPQLVKSPLDYDTKMYTVKGEKYAAIKIEPGMWVDRGGEVNITWVANKTGKRASKNFIIDANGMLKSLVLSAPVGTVADGDKDVKIPYTATDTNGKNVTNYSTIVRSTNTLTLNSSVGTLRIEEEDDGTAGIYWDDTDKETGYKDKTAFDEQDRPVSLTTIVLGGESSNMLFNVSDKRRPTTIDAVNIGDDETGLSGELVVSGDVRNVEISDWGQFRFIDQYGKPMINEDPEIFQRTNDLAQEFFDLGAKGELNDEYLYGIKVETSTPKVVGTENKVYMKDSDNGLGLSLKFASEEEGKRTSGNVKYSIAKIKKDAKAEDKADIANWDNVSKVKTETYTIVPVTDVYGIQVDGLDDRLKVVTSLSEEPNGESSGMTSGAFKEYATGKDGETTELKIEKVGRYGITYRPTYDFSITGVVDGKKVKIPMKYVNEADNSSFKLLKRGEEGFGWSLMDYRITAVNKDNLKWNDLYNVNDAIKSRKDAVKELRLTIDKGVDSDNEPVKEMVKKSVTISDAPSAIAEIKWPENRTPGKYISMSKINEYSDEYKLNDDKTAIDANVRDGYAAMVFDQYTGELLPSGAKYRDEDYNLADYVDGVEVEYSVSNIVENTNALAYKPNSFKTIGNSTSKLQITGAEIGDKYTIKATVAGTTLSISKDVTVLADKAAVLYSTKPEGANDDIDLRKQLLGYDR